MSPDEYKAARVLRGLTQAGLAELLGLDPQTISRRERGELPITREAALALSALPKSKRRSKPQNH